MEDLWTTWGRNWTGKMRADGRQTSNADSIIEHEGQSIFVKPYEMELPFSTAVAKIRAQEQDPDYKGPKIPTSTLILLS
jgi:hypothetical protein